MIVNNQEYTFKQVCLYSIGILILIILLPITTLILKRLEYMSTKEKINKLYNAVFSDDGGIEFHSRSETLEDRIEHLELLVKLLLEKGKVKYERIEEDRLTNVK